MSLSLTQWSLTHHMIQCEEIFPFLIVTHLICLLPSSYLVVPFPSGNPTSGNPTSGSYLRIQNCDDYYWGHPNSLGISQYEFLWNPRHGKFLDLNFSPCPEIFSVSLITDFSPETLKSRNLLGISLFISRKLPFWSCYRFLKSTHSLA